MFYLPSVARRKRSSAWWACSFSPVFAFHGETRLPVSKDDCTFKDIIVSFINMFVSFNCTYRYSLIFFVVRHDFTYIYIYIHTYGAAPFL